MDKSEREILICQVLQDIEDNKATTDNNGTFLGILPFDKEEWGKFKTIVINRRK